MYPILNVSDDTDPLDLSLETGPLDDLTFQMDNFQFSSFPTNLPAKPMSPAQR